MTATATDTRASRCSPVTFAPHCLGQCGPPGTAALAGGTVEALPQLVVADDEPDRLVVTHLEALDDALIIAAGRFGEVLGGCPVRHPRLPASRPDAALIVDATAASVAARAVFDPGSLAVPVRRCSFSIARYSYASSVGASAQVPSSASRACAAARTSIGRSSSPGIDG